MMCPPLVTVSLPRQAVLLHGRFWRGRGAMVDLRCNPSYISSDRPNVQSNHPPDRMWGPGSGTRASLSLPRCYWTSGRLPPPHTLHSTQQFHCVRVSWDAIRLCIPHQTAYILAPMGFERACKREVRTRVLEWRGAIDFTYIRFVRQTSHLAPYPPQATRGFAPEAANLWALEVFPTESRATKYAVVNVAYQLTATVAVPLASIGQGASPSLILLVYAGMQLALGAFASFLPKETVNRALDD